MTPIDQKPVVLLAGLDAVINVDTADALIAAGYAVLGPVSTQAEALQMLEQDGPTLAVIDVVLRDGSCTELTRVLRDRGVPFLVHSDYRQDQCLGSDLGSVPWLIKPASGNDVVALCDELAPSVPVARVGMSPTDGSTALHLVPPPSGTVNPLIRKLEGFAALTDAERAMLERISAESRLVGPPTDLAREGDRPEGVFLVMDGIACRHKLRANGARQIMAYLVPGDLCDLDVALLDEMDHTITTFSTCRVVRIAPETVASLLRDYPQIARALRKSTLVDEATLREWLVNVGRRSAVERLAHLFCELLLRMRAVGLSMENSYGLPLTQADLADTTGLSTVHVNRSLAVLRRQGLIELQGGRLRLLDVPRLRALAEFKANYLHLGDRAAA